MKKITNENYITIIKNWYNNDTDRDTIYICHSSYISLFRIEEQAFFENVIIDINPYINSANLRTVEFTDIIEK